MTSKAVQLLKLLSCNNTTSQEDVLRALNINAKMLPVLLQQVDNNNRGVVCFDKNSNSYVLSDKLNWLDPDIISQLLHVKQLPNYTIRLIAELDSTNNYMLNCLKRFEDKTIVVTEYQNDGRGRTDKKWSSKIGIDLTVSVLYKFEKHFEFELFPLVVAVAIIRLLKFYRVTTKIKWPNDVYLPNGDKIGGILIESGIRNDNRFIIVGVGLDNIWEFERNKLLVDFIEQLDTIINEYRIFGFGLIRQEWLDNCIHYLKFIEIYQDSKVIDSGININVSTSGKIVIKNMYGIKEYSPTSIKFSL